MEINSYKDTKPTWDILPFDEVIDQIPRRGKDGLRHNPLDPDMAFCFTGKEFGKGVYFLPKTGTIVNAQTRICGKEDLSDAFGTKVVGAFPAKKTKEKFVKPFIYGMIIGDNFVYRKFEIAVTCKRTGRESFEGNMIPVREVCRYVFGKSGLIIEKRYRSRKAISVEEIPDKDIYDTMLNMDVSYHTDLQWAFVRDVKITHKAEIVNAFSHIKKKVKVFAFNTFCAIYSKANENIGIDKDTPKYIVNDLYGRKLRLNSSGKIDNVLTAITGVWDSEYLDFHEEVRTYIDAERAYFFRKNALTGKWQSDSMRDYLADNQQLRARTINTNILKNTYAEKILSHANGIDFSKPGRIGLGHLFAQLTFLSAEQAAKIDFRLYNVILKNIYNGWIENTNLSLSDLLGLTGPQIKFLNGINIPDDLDKFGKCMRDKDFVEHFPDIKKRIFAVSFYLEYYSRWMRSNGCLSKEELFESVQTLNSLEKTDIEKRKLLALEYRDYLRMRKDYRGYVKHMRKDDPLKKEITEFGEAPINIKPSKISDYHSKIERILDIMGCSDTIVENSNAIEERYKKESKTREYTNGKYSILMPKNAYEIIDEGRGLDHCVGRAGYIESMAANMCTILFLRDNENLSAPLITIEEKQGSIKQCYGYRDSINHNIQIRDFIIEYAKSRDLSINAQIYSQKHA